MGCGCGGNGNGGGCGGGLQPLPEALASAPVVQEVVPESRSETDEALKEEDEAPGELIASSEQEWPRIKVNGVRIAPEAMQILRD